MLRERGGAKKMFQKAAFVLAFWSLGGGAAPPLTQEKIDDVSAQFINLQEKFMSYKEVLGRTAGKPLYALLSDDEKEDFEYANNQCLKNAQDALETLEKLQDDTVSHPNWDGFVNARNASNELSNLKLKIDLCRVISMLETQISELTGKSEETRHSDVYNEILSYFL